MNNELLPVIINFAFNESAYCYIKRSNINYIKRKLKKSCMPELVYLELLNEEKILPIGQKELTKLDKDCFIKINAIKRLTPEELASCLEYYVKKIV